MIFVVLYIFSCHINYVNYFLEHVSFGYLYHLPKLTVKNVRECFNAVSLCRPQNSTIQKFYIIYNMSYYYHHYYNYITYSVCAQLYYTTCLKCD